MAFEAGNKADGKHYWLTPLDMMDDLQREFEFDFDPCPYPKPDEFNGLIADWGKSNYVNPPFGAYTDTSDGKKKGPTAWARKCIEEYKKGKIVVMVYPIDKWVLMSRYPDKFFDLAICDPPYGIGKNWNKDRYSRHYKNNKSYDNASIPEKTYFHELFRVSKEQIIWGYNYYAHYIPLSNNIIVWDKVLTYEKGFKSEGELAWTSIKRYPLRIYKHQWDGAKKGTENGKIETIHPHQKPVHLYRWLLKLYATPGHTILDTHLGSGSIAIACHDMGFDLTACELDTDYYNAACKRLKQHQAQLTIF